FFYQAEDGRRAATVTGVQTCALPIYFSTSSRLISCPFTAAHTSGVGRDSCPHPLARRSAQTGRIVPRSLGAFFLAESGRGECKAGSGGFFHAARADARGTHAHVPTHAIHDRAHAPQIRLPPAPARIIRVTDHVPIVRCLAAQFTLRCHGSPTHPVQNFPARRAPSLSDLRSPV